MSGTGVGKANTTKGTIPGVGVDLNKPADTFKFVMVLCAVIFVLAVFFFSFMRLKFRQIYAPRFLLIENKMFGIGNAPKKSFFSWMLLAFQTSDEDIYTFAGIDALVFLRFLRLLLKFSICTMPYGLIVLLPINIYGHNNLKDGLDKLSMSNVEHKSSHLWAHWVAVWVYSMLVFYLSFKEWKVYISYRQRYLKKGSGHQFAVLVREIPEKETEDNAFYEAVNKLFPNKVASVYVIKNLNKWDDLIKKHDKFVLKWENVKYHLENNNVRKQIRQKPCGDKVDAINEYEEQLELIQEELMAEQSRGEKPPLRCAFVFFKSLKAKTSALQSVWTSDPMIYHVYSAPEASDIKWDSLRIRFPIRILLEAIGFIIVFFLVIFWAVPITFISSLTNLETLTKQFKWLDSIFNGSSKMLISFIQGVLPVILIAVFYVILPYILFFITRIQGHFSGSSCTEMVFKYLFVFQTFNTFFIYIISGSVIQNLQGILDRPFDLPNLLAKSLPSQSGFFVNYLALTSFVGLAIELTRIVPLILISIKLKWIAKTARERLEAWKPKRPEYEIMYSQALLFFLIGISYSILSPIIVPFVVLYFAFGYIVWLYQLLHVYISEYEHGGRFWPYVFHRMMAAVLVFQILMVGVFLLKEIWFAAVFLAPLIVLSVFFWLFISKNYSDYGEYLVSDQAVGTKYAEGHFLDEVRQRYIRDYNLPDVFEVSSDKEVAGDDYIPIDSLNVDTDEENTTEMRENSRLLNR